MNLSITDVVRHTGVPSSTLRYYERVGLLRAAGRGSNGYRRYEERALDRLRFIARAKELGCSLNEIATLLEAFDSDCPDVQLPLRELVDVKIADAQRRIAELIAFTAQLQSARHTLAAEAAAGPCGPGCACMIATAAPEPPRPGVQLVMAQPSIACTIEPAMAGERIVDWQAILDHVTERGQIDGGVRLGFGPDIDLAEVTRLAQAEWECCSFIAFSITVDGRGVALEVRAPAEARDLVTSVFGVA